MTNPMSIMARLKTETADLHTAAESSPLQRQLVKGDLSRDQYAAFLGQMYLVHAALEQAIRDGSASHAGFETVVREYHDREPQLREDLAFLGVKLDDIAPVGATATTMSDIARTAADRPIALLGVAGLGVIQTRDALLVCSLDRAQDVRRIVEELARLGRAELT